MNVRRIIGLSVLAASLSSLAIAAEESTVADAVEHGNSKLALALIHDGADVNARQVDGMTALHWAVYQDDSHTSTLLVKSGANVNAGNDYGVTPLSLAATNANATVVNLLLDAGADAKATLRGGETVLMTAARTGSVEVVTALLTEGVDPNGREGNNQTALMWASAEGHLPVVEALVQAGADVHASLNSGFSPIFFAVREGHIDVARSLIAAGVDVNQVLQRVQDRPDQAVNNASYRPVDDGMSPLLLAVRNGHFELAVELIKAGADPNDQRTGFTPLHTMSWVRKPDASDRGDPSPTGSGHLTPLQFVRVLVALGADVNTQLDQSTRPPHTASRLGTEGATAFLMAADRADDALMQLLVDLGADPFIPNAELSTPLMAAAGLGTSAPEEEAGTEAEAVIATQMLIDLGANLDAVDSNGDSAMHGAAYGNFPSVVHLLAANGADSQVWRQTNELGRTPLYIAEGHRGGLPRQSRPTIDAVEYVMSLENISTAGQRPEIVDQYARPATQQQ
ncbi:MAG: hypothetical protein CL484_14710 [Acidobacteria bacterium]|nr:hypothetical protein [Acidobacteriota bacterium]